MTPWWQHYDTLPAGFDRVPPRHVTLLSCVSNPSQHTHTHTHNTQHTTQLTYKLYPLEAITHPSFFLMPRRPIRLCLMRRSVTHLRMHDKVLLDFPVATVCSLLAPLNRQERTHTNCLLTTSTFICDRGYVSKDITSADGEIMRVWTGGQSIYSCLRQWETSWIAGNWCFMTGCLSFYFQTKGC